MSLDTAAMVRLLMFAGGGGDELFRFLLSTRSEAARVRETLLHVGIPWLRADAARQDAALLVDELGRAA